MLKQIVVTSIMLASVVSHSAADTKIVAWNASPQLFESVQARKSDLEKLNSDLQPDVLVLIEVAGLEEAKVLAASLGWQDYNLAVSDWAKMSTNVYFALETAVVSKIPIEKTIELDPTPDGVNPVVDQDGNATSASVDEVEADTKGISGINTLARTDRVSMRVDLSNGLTVFPVHLKSNRNSVCGLASDLNKNLRKLGVAENSDIEDMLSNGFEAATKETLSNAMKRERVIAAVKLEADKAIDEGREVVIAGDFNTSFEDGKAGSAFADCTLQDFSCSRAPFPAEACSDGDGYDDTFAILTESLVGKKQWDVLTSELGRTYDDDAFADRAIDHIAVPADMSASFSSVGKADKTYGSDHFPVFVTHK